MDRERWRKDHVQNQIKWRIITEHPKQKENLKNVFQFKYRAVIAIATGIKLESKCIVTGCSGNYLLYVLTYP